jgi:hypothetical protein
MSCNIKNIGTIMLLYGLSYTFFKYIKKCFGCKLNNSETQTPRNLNKKDISTQTNITDNYDYLEINKEDCDDHNLIEI